MTVLWTAAEAAAALGLTPSGDWAARNVSIDSRVVEPGDLFVAIVGEQFDGHDFVEAAFAKGAVAAMTNRRISDVPQLIVPDTLAGLARLGEAARARSAAKVAAVTGSVGKTGTKEMLALALGDQGRTHANLGNLNNHIGAPLSLARLPREADFAVFELGMNHPGEIAPLSRMVRPSVAIITTIEPVHLEFFENEEGIADEKAQIFAGLHSGGIAVLNRDNHHFKRLKRHADALGLTVVTFGAGDLADFRLLESLDELDGVMVGAAIRGRTLSYRIGCPGRHWAFNSLAVLAAVEALGGDLAKAAASLAKVTPPKGRGATKMVELPGGGIATLIDESYNASPAAVRAAIAVLARRTPAATGRRIFLLGDMLELGPTAAKLHEQLAEDFTTLGIDRVHTVGPLSHGLHKALPEAMRGIHAERAADIVDSLKGDLRPGDVITIKGSLGSKMGLVVAALTAGVS